MTGRKYSYDMECEALARFFLESEWNQIKEEERDGVICDLAQTIQETVEDFILVERVGNRWKLQDTDVRFPTAPSGNPQLPEASKED
jgi:hypothetical protein